MHSNSAKGVKVHQVVNDRLSMQGTHHQLRNASSYLFLLDGFTNISDHIHNVNFKKVRRRIVWALLDHFLNATSAALHPL